MKYLPDTNIIILALHAREPEASFLSRQIAKNALELSTIVVAEFYVKSNPTEEKLFEKLISSFGSMSIDTEVAKTAGLYRKQFLRKTNRVFLTDCFLAAQAKLHNLTLVTNNRADFPMNDIKVVSPK